jgi:hypothetical protein
MGLFHLKDLGRWSLMVIGKDFKSDCHDLFHSALQNLPEEDFENLSD